MAVVRPSGVFDTQRKRIASGGGCFMAMVRQVPPRGDAGRSWFKTIPPKDASANW